MNMNRARAQRARCVNVITISAPRSALSLRNAIKRVSRRNCSAAAGFRSSMRTSHAGWLFACFVLVVVLPWYLCVRMHLRSAERLASTQEDVNPSDRTQQMRPHRGGRLWMLCACFSSAPRLDGAGVFLVIAIMETNMWRQR